jgi:hypothetical protein
MTAIEHLPERLVVVSWDSPRAVPAVVRAADKMPPRDGEVEYVRADLHLGAVEETERLHHVIDEAYLSLRAGRTAEAFEYLRVAACHPTGGGR